MSIYDEGNEISLVAISKPDFTIKLLEYQDKGYLFREDSLSVTGYVYKWKMDRDPDFVASESRDENGVSDENSSVTEQPVPLTEETLTQALEEAEQDFLPDFEKVDAMIAGKETKAEVKAAKIELEEYARTFGVELNRSRNFANMRKDFVKACKQ